MKLKVNDAITMKSFVGFVIAVFVFFFMNVSFSLEWSLSFKFLLYVTLTAMIMILGIQRPGITAFMRDVFEALNDGRIDASEKLRLIQSAKDNLFSTWAELTEEVYKKESDT
jgi:cobalamin biosynthesis protein CobD/CbiB